MPRGVGGDQRAIERAAMGGGQALGHGRLQDLTIPVQEVGPDAIAEGIAAAARRLDPAAQPQEAATIARVGGPLTGRVVTGLHLVQDDLEHQVRAMGPRADAGIGGEQGRQIESVDRRVDGAGEMVDGQGIVEGEPFGGLMIPRGQGEAIEVGVVARWRRGDRRQRFDRWIG